MIDILLLLIAFLAVLILVALSSLYLYGFFNNHNKNIPDFTPNVCVIVPCKGKEQNLEQNLEAICTQNYPKFTVVFVVDSKKDDAYPSVFHIVQKMKNSKVELSKKLDGCSGKISALITGIKNAGDASVYVFADSDICPHDEWLKNLVSYLSDEKIGATTGYRWYFPYNWMSSLISTWNLATISGLFHPLSSYAWGGSTAIKKSLFETLPIEAEWKTGFSDDLILTGVVKNAGYKIRFHPACLVESPAEISLKKFLFWGTQQFTWVRWYTPLSWFISSCGLLLLTFFPLFGLILIGIGFPLAGGIMISLLFFEMIYGLVGILTLKQLMRYPKKKFRFMYRYVILMPVVFFLYTYNILISGGKKQILWGGRIYQKRDAIK